MLPRGASPSVSTFSSHGDSRAPQTGSSRTHRLLPTAVFLVPQALAAHGPAWLWDPISLLALESQAFNPAAAHGTGEASPARPGHPCRAVGQLCGGLGLHGGSGLYPARTRGAGWSPESLLLCTASL